MIVIMIMIMIIIIIIIIIIISVSRMAGHNSSPLLYDSYAGVGWSGLSQQLHTNLRMHMWGTILTQSPLET